MGRLQCLLVAFAACGSNERTPAEGSGSASSGSAVASPLHALARVPGATLVAGTRRVALVTDTEWRESPFTRATPGYAEQLAPLRELGGDLQIFLGRTPIVFAGEEHHERSARLGRDAGPAPALAGDPVRVATTRAGIEVWQYDEALRARLAVVDARGTVTPLPDLALAGPAVTTMSPVGTKKCKAPQIADLASTADDAIAALVVECSPDAPVRVVVYRWPGPTANETRLPRLDFAPVALAGTTVVGIRDGKLAIVGSKASIAATAVLAAAAADDGAAWTLASSPSGNVVARAGVALALPGVPTRLAYDEHHGIVVLLADGTLLGER